MFGNRPLLTGVVFVAVLLGSLLVSPLASANDDDREGLTVVVRPTGGDDTDNLQKALESCVDARRSCRVLLTPGVFHTRVLVVYDFNGVLQGAGKHRTIIEALTPVPVTQEKPFFHLSPPTPENPWPYLLIFVDGKIVIRDLTLRVTEAPATEGWFIFGDIELDFLSSLILITGTSADAYVRNIHVEGEAVSLINGIWYSGLLLKEDAAHPFDFELLGGTYHLTHSSFAKVPFGSPVAFVDHVRILILGNRYEGTVGALDVTGPLEDSRVVVAHNKITGAAWYGIGLFDAPALVWGNTVSDSSIGILLSGAETAGSVVALNRLRGNEVGILLEGATETTVALNRVYDSGLGIALLGIYSDGTLIAGPSDNLVLRNRVKGSSAFDLFWDETGSGNQWIRNRCQTSSPEGLCG